MRMNRIKNSIACFQILIMVFLALCSAGIVINPPKKQVAFSCMDHECGCKSEADCRTNCCCFPAGDRLVSQNDAKQQRNGYHSFISSLQCKSGSNTLAFIKSNLKYIEEYSAIDYRLTFLCFLCNDPFIQPCEPVVSPPEKPPRYRS